MNMKLKKYNPDATSTGDQTRRISIAVASWLCGTLEGLSGDYDATLADALDIWLRRQKDELRTIYTGLVTCSVCGHTQERMISSDDVTLCCSGCGNVQKTASLLPCAARKEPENRDALNRIRKEIGDVISRIGLIFPASVHSDNEQ